MTYLGQDRRSCPGGSRCCSVWPVRSFPAGQSRSQPEKFKGQRNQAVGPRNTTTRRLGPGIPEQGRWAQELHPPIINNPPTNRKWIFMHAPLFLWLMAFRLPARVSRNKLIFLCLRQLFPIFKIFESCYELPWPEPRWLYLWLWEAQALHAHICGSFCVQFLRM